MTNPTEPCQPKVTDALVSSSGLVRWLHQHRDELQQRQQAGRISWRTLADVLQHEGVKDDAGKEPTADAIRRAWYRVRKTPLVPPAPVAPASLPDAGLHNTKEDNGLHNTTVLHNPESPPDPAPVKSALSPILPEQRTRPRRTMATLRGMEQAAPPTAPATQTTASKPEPLNADDVLRDLGIEP